jgi:hypothetical protein
MCEEAIIEAPIAPLYPAIVTLPPATTLLSRPSSFHLSRRRLSSVTMSTSVAVKTNVPFAEELRPERA